VTSIGYEVFESVEVEISRAGSALSGRQQDRSEPFDFPGRRAGQDGWVKFLHYRGSNGKPNLNL
jgi:hypothetical protein